MSWIPVEDRLPPDDKWVLVLCRNSQGKARRLRAIHASKFSLPVSPETDAVDFGEYDEKTDEFYCPPGWYESNEFEDTNWLIGHEVTHWAELPDLPPGYNA